MLDRNNELENKVLSIIENNINLTTGGTYESKSFNYSTYLLRRKYEGDKLFLDAPSPYKTEKDNNRRTEFALQCPDFNIDVRIECKASKKDNSIAGTADIDLMRVPKAPEREYWMILEGKGYNNPEIKKHLKVIKKAYGVENKVKIFTFEEFEKHLKKCVSS